MRIIFQAILLALAAFHFFKHQYKEMKAALVTFILSFLTVLLDKLVHVNVDAFSSFLYFVIIFMALYLGSSLRFYDRYKWWDRTIHLLSGASFTGFGIAIAGNNPGTTKWLALLFSFSFSITLHMFWEVLEYLSDCITHKNAQRWQKVNDSVNHVSDKAIQPAGLVDTMNDSICCMIGTILAVIAWWMVF